MIIMGGGHEVPNISASAEFNIWADPEAAASVFEAGFKDVLMVPLDATHKALVTAKECAAFGALGTPAGMATETVIKRRIGSYESSQKMDVPESAPVHDALCVAALVEPDIITTKRCNVAVETTAPSPLAVRLLTRTTAAARSQTPTLPLTPTPRDSLR